MRYLFWCLTQSLLSLTFSLVLAGCTDTETPILPYVPKNYTQEISVGEVTVLQDIDSDPYAFQLVAVGYCDVTGSGEQRALVCHLSSDVSVIEKTEILSSASLSSLDLIRYKDERTFVAVGSGPVSSPTLYYIHEEDGVSSNHTVGYQGERVHPTGLVVEQNDLIVVAGWLEDGPQIKAFVAGLNPSGGIQWSQYYQQPGYDVKAEDLISSPDGYVVACSYYKDDKTEEATYSKLYAVDKNGNHVDTVSMDFPAFHLSEVELWTRSTEVRGHEEFLGYVVAGVSYSATKQIKQGLIGIIDVEGYVEWQDVPVENLEFNPVSLIWYPDRSIFRYFVLGNVDNQRKAFFIAQENGFSVREAEIMNSDPTISKHVTMHIYDDFEIILEVRKFSYNTERMFAKATAFIGIWER